VDAGDFIEIHCAADLDVCEQRDTKGLYAKARAGEIKEFTGISSPYEAPEHPELRVDTGNQNLEESVEQVISYLAGQGVIPPAG
jgi:adenylylsulfate kinase